MTTAPIIFDPIALRSGRQRANPTVLANHPLLDEVAAALAMRLQAVRRPFARLLDLGSPSPLLSQAVSSPTRQVCHLIPAGLSIAGAYRGYPNILPVIAEDWLQLPLADHSVDACISMFSLHTVNDVLGCLQEIKRVLRPDGLLLASFYGEDNLNELKQCLLQADLRVSGGIYPRMHPVTAIKNVGQMLQTAGFALPVADVTHLEILYPNIKSLLKDLQALGERNSTVIRPRHPTRRGVFEQAGQFYQQQFGREDGLIPATINLMTITAWSPDPSNQPQALKRGSGQVSLHQALNTPKL
ncbi:MAG: methyltransferase domain-containing protein [Alphaproteobacteria bacterium]|nr:methyltransferase domain-containing protein [Alphaproteobacteria bacterium]